MNSADRQMVGGQGLKLRKSSGDDSLLLFWAHWGQPPLNTKSTLLPSDRNQCQIAKSLTCFFFSLCGQNKNSVHFLSKDNTLKCFAINYVVKRQTWKLE